MSISSFFGKIFNRSGSESEGPYTRQLHESTAHSTGAKGFMEKLFSPLLRAASGFNDMIDPDGDGRIGRSSNSQPDRSSDRGDIEEALRSNPEAARAFKGTGASQGQSYHQTQRSGNSEHSR